MTQPPTNATATQQPVKIPAKKPESVMGKLRFRLSKTKLRVPMQWLRHRGFRPADMFFSTYPRSGTTWTRFTMFEILTGESATFESVNSVMLGVGMQDQAKAILPGGGRLIGTHESYRKEYKRAVYLVRDVRDVILSEYAFITALDRFHGTLDDFIRDFFRGKINGFGAWPRHVTSWLDSPIAGTSNLLVLKYEDLRQDPETSFRRMLDFAGMKREQEAIRQAIANNSLEKMREKEIDSPRKASVRGRFVRTGQVQGWRGKLSDEQLRVIEAKAGEVLVRMGYPLVTNSRSAGSAQADPEGAMTANVRGSV
ncbi:MAG: sulfotransferase domain-containing protein [Terriglobales bacterium]